jgi:hypothetical protein
MQNVHISVNSAHFSPIFICFLPQNIDFSPKNTSKMIKKNPKTPKNGQFREPVGSRKLGRLH